MGKLPSVKRRLQHVAGTEQWGGWEASSLGRGGVQEGGHSCTLLFCSLWPGFCSHWPLKLFSNDPQAYNPAWTSPLNARHLSPTTSLTLPPENLLGHLELNVSEGELLMSLPKPFPPHQKTHRLFLKIDLESTTPHHFTATSLIPATIISRPHSFGSLRIGLSASTLAPLQVVLNRVASEPSKHHVRLCSFTSQNPLMASHFTQTRSQVLAWPAVLV